MTTVADAIRSKAGGSDPLSFPDGFVSAVEGITTGGGSSDPADNKWAAMIARPSTAVDIREEDWIPSVVADSAIRQYAFSGNRGRVVIPANYSVSSYCFTDFGTLAEPGEVVFADTDGYHSFGTNSFSSSRMKSWPQGLNHFRNNTTGYGMFLNASFAEDVIVPDGVTTINTQTFGSTNKISDGAYASLTLTLPASVATIENLAIAGDYSGHEIILKMLGSTPPTLVGTQSLQRIASITVPAGSLQAYQEATNWAQFADIMVEASA